MNIAISPLSCPSTAKAYGELKMNRKLVYCLGCLLHGNPVFRQSFQSVTIPMGKVDYGFFFACFKKSVESGRQYVFFIFFGVGHY